jgi:hypothetical protein
LERTRVRREAAILRALQSEGVEGVAALLGVCGTTYVTEATPFTLEELLLPDLFAEVGAAAAAVEASMTHTLETAEAAAGAAAGAATQAGARSRQFTPSHLELSCSLLSLLPLPPICHHKQLELL